MGAMREWARAQERAAACCRATWRSSSACRAREGPPHLASWAVCRRAPRLRLAAACVPAPCVADERPQVPTPNVTAPWQARLLLCFATSGCYICGGTLVTPTTVLTAAHCISDSPADELASVAVGLGAPPAARLPRAARCGH